MTPAVKRLYRFLVEVERITKEEYKRYVGEPYDREN